MMMTLRRALNFLLLGRRFEAAHQRNGAAADRLDEVVREVLKK